MREKIEAWKSHVRDVSSRPDFIHHEWFVPWHLEIVERIALELCDKYPAADRELVEVMVWLHDYGKALNFDKEYEKAQTEGQKKLAELGFEPEFIIAALQKIDTMNKKMELDLHEAPLEVQIVASADGCSHLVGPFMSVYWREHPELNPDEFIASSLRKLNKDWDRKITLPEARTAFQLRHDFFLEQFGKMPTSFL